MRNEKTGFAGCKIRMLLLQQADRMLLLQQADLAFQPLCLSMIM